MSTAFSKQEHWSGLPVLLQGIFSSQGWNSHLLRFLHQQVDSLHSVTWEAHSLHWGCQIPLGEELYLKPREASCPPAFRAHLPLGELLHPWGVSPQWTQYSICGEENFKPMFPHIGSKTTSIFVCQPLWPCRFFSPLSLSYCYCILLVCLLTSNLCFAFSLSCDFFATPWTVAHQAPLSMGFSRQGYWSELPWSPPGDLPNPGLERRCPALQVDSLPSEEPPEKQKFSWYLILTS